MKVFFVALLTAGMVAASSFAAASVVVYSNNMSPGDDFTNATTTNTNLATAGAALGSSGWYYNNVRNNGHVGVSTNFAYDGNGSAWFASTQGPGGASSKADIEYYNIVGGTAQALGTLGDLTSLSYSWYRQSGGSAAQWLVPVLRLYVKSADGLKAGYLIFEPVYNELGNGAAAINQWVTEDIVQMNAHLWSTGTLPSAFSDYYSSNVLLSSWQSLYGNYVVYGLSAGVGSGWGTFSGAVDDITVGFGDGATTYNFEVAQAVPEPATLGIWSLLGIVGLMIGRRRRVSQP